MFYFWSVFWSVSDPFYFNLWSFSYFQWFMNGSIAKFSPHLNHLYCSKCKNHCKDSQHLTQFHYRCHFCPFQTVNKIEFKFHHLRNHGIYMEKAVKLTSKTHYFTLNKAKKKLFCDLCDQEIQDMKRTRDHFTHFKCPQCDFCSTSVQNLKSHECLKRPKIVKLSMKKGALAKSM